MKRFQHVSKCGFVIFHIFFMNITFQSAHICRLTDRYYLWNDRFSILWQKFCPFVGFLDLTNSMTWSVSFKTRQIKIKKPYLTSVIILTDNISSWAILRHNNQQILTFTLSPSTTLLMRASARELLVPFLTPLVWRDRGANPRPTAPEAHALTTRLSGPRQDLFWVGKTYNNKHKLQSAFEPTIWKTCIKSTYVQQLQKNSLSYLNIRHN